MLVKTRGIVFKFFKYRDTSIIAKVYTEEFGLQSYVVNGIRKSKGKIALFQPLTLLDLVVYKKQHTEINRISQFSCSNQFSTIPYQIAKSSIAVFLSEVLYKCIRQDEQAPALFDFIYHSILVLDQLESNYQNFHLQFLIKLSGHLGFGISGLEQFAHTTDPAMEMKIDQLIKSAYTDLLQIGNQSRRAILDDLIRFYHTHVDGLGEIKSIQILQTILG